MNPPTLNLSRIFIKQVFELGEIFGFETRNKYRILDETGRDLAFAAEQQKGILGFLFRQYLGHWRSFEIHFFSADRQQFMTARHPFRWFFQRLEVVDRDERLVGAIERRFAILSKSFHVENEMGQTVMEVSSPFWRVWTFPFFRQGREVARISKKWSGLGSELFTDRDNFLVEYLDSNLPERERSLVLAASIYIDLMYFKRKGNGGLIDLNR